MTSDPKIGNHRNAPQRNFHSVNTHAPLYQDFNKKSRIVIDQSNSIFKDRPRDDFEHNLIKTNSTEAYLANQEYQTQNKFYTINNDAAKVNSYI